MGSIVYQAGKGDENCFGVVATGIEMENVYVQLIHNRIEERIENSDVYQLTIEEVLMMILWYGG